MVSTNHEVLIPGINNLSSDELIEAVNNLLANPETSFLIHGLLSDEMAKEDIVFLNSPILTPEMLKTTKKSYTSHGDYYGAKYELPSNMVKRTWESYLKYFTATLVKGDSVGVFGCGNGRDVMQLASHGLQVTAMDNSDSMLNAMRAWGNGAINVQKVDVTKATKIFQGDNFNGILAESVLEHVNKRDVKNLVLKDFPMMLKYQGKLLFRLRLHSSGNVMKSNDGVGIRYFSTWSQNEVEELVEEMTYTYKGVNTWVSSHKHQNRPPFFTIQAVNKRGE